MRNRRSALSRPADASRARWRNSASISPLTVSGGQLRAAAIALIGRGELVGVAGRCDECGDDLRIEHRTPGGHLADRPGQPVAVTDPVLEEVREARGAVGEQRDGVLRLVVLREDHGAGPRQPPADLLGGLDALVLEARRHPDVGDDDLRAQPGGGLDELVVVGGEADDLDVGVAVEEHPHALTDYEVVVGEHDTDPLHAVITPQSGAQRTVGQDHSCPGAGTPRFPPVSALCEGTPRA
jgi:hypothetical protein